MKPKTNKNFTSLNKIFTEKNIDPKLKNAFYKHQALKNWQVVAGKFLQETFEQTRAIDFKNGVLIIACLSKDLAFQIKLLAGRIMYEINKLIGKAVVFGIYTQS